jgi:hypothetical protein
MKEEVNEYWSKIVLPGISEWEGIDRKQKLIAEIESVG